MPRRSSQRIAEPPAPEAKKPSSILAPDPNAIPPQIRSNENKKADEHDNDPGLKIVGPAPYDSDDVANAERDTIDYSIKVSFTLFLS